MSFFSKLGKELDSMFDSKDKDKKEDKVKEDKPPKTEEHVSDANRGTDSYSGYPPQAPTYNYPPQGHSPSPYGAPQQPYGAPSPSHSQSPYGAPPQPPYGQHAASPYGVPPAPSPYSAPPPSHDSHQQSHAPYGAPASVSSLYDQTRGSGYPTQAQAPQVPQGWLPLWDPAGQRWAYLDQNTQKVDWNFPTAPSYPGQHGDVARGYESHGAPYGAAAAGYYAGHDSHGYDAHKDGHQGGHDVYTGEKDKKDKDKKDKKKSGSNDMLVAGVAGLAVGGVGGALIANAMDDDDPAVVNNYYSGAPPPAAAPSAYPPQGDFPDETASGSSVSSSDIEELEEAREAYEEAYEETYGSD